MKSQTRAWIAGLILFVTWSTPFTAPFRYFAGMLSETARWTGAQTGLSAAWTTWFEFFLLALIGSLLFWLGRGRQRLYLAGYAALAELAYHLWTSYRDQQAWDVPLPITIAIALALLFHLLTAKSPGLWLADAFIMAIPVSLVVEGFLAGLYATLDWPRRLLAPLLIIPDDASILALAGWLGAPLLVWATLSLFLAILPPLFLSGGRAKG